MHCQYFPSLQLKHFLGNMPGTIGRVKAQNRKEGWVGGAGGGTGLNKHTLYTAMFLKTCKLRGNGVQKFKED